jgi:uncharacterized protein YegL
MDSPNKKYCSRISTGYVKDQIENEGLFDEEDTKFLHRDCPVCIGEYTTEVGIDKINICKPCNHPFCRDCLCTWAKTHNTCPTCKGEIESILVEKNIEKSFEVYCVENNIPPRNLNNIFDDFDDLSQLAFEPFQQSFGRSNFNENIDNDFELKSSIPIAGIANISNTTEYAVINTNSVLSFITNSFNNDENNDDILCILDISGSMEGQKIEKSKQGIISIINSLKTFQRISVVLFNNNTKHLFGLQQITVSNKNELISNINNIYSGGGTEYNPALRTIKEIFDESNNEIQRKRIVLFFSDGEHTDTPNMNILDETYDSYPELLFYTISMGNNIDASVNLIPLHRSRPVELGRYFDCPNMENFTQIIENIIGNSRPLFLKDLCITFPNNIKLFTTYQKVLNDDTTFSITIPILNVGDIINIAFKIENDNFDIENMNISYTFIRVSDNEEINGVSVFDENNILPKEISIDYPKSRYLINDINEIVDSTSLTKEEKKNMLIEIRKDINPENNGIYYQMLLDTINKYIELQSESNMSMAFVNSVFSQRQTSIVETSPSFVSRDVSGRLFSQSYVSSSDDDDDN